MIRCRLDFYEGDFIERDYRVLGGHEMGHALGILRHPRRVTDIMGSTFTGVTPSMADFHTMRHLYARPE